MGRETAALVTLQPGGATSLTRPQLESCEIRGCCPTVDPKKEGGTDLGSYQWPLSQRHQQDTPPQSAERVKCKVRWLTQLPAGPRASQILLFFFSFLYQLFP